MRVALTHSKKARGGETTCSHEQEGLTRACTDVKTACKGTWVTLQDEPTLCWDQTHRPLPPSRKTLLSPISQHCHKPPHHQLHTEEISHMAGRPPDFLSQQSQGLGLLLSSLPHPHPQNTITLQNALSRRGTPTVSTGCERRKGCGLAGGGAATCLRQLCPSSCTRMCSVSVGPGCEHPTHLPF